MNYIMKKKFELYNEKTKKESLFMNDHQQIPRIFNLLIYQSPESNLQNFPNPNYEVQQYARNPNPYVQNQINFNNTSKEVPN